MTWLTSYCDAAGHPKGKHALAVGGYVSSVQQWLRFEKAWKRTLEKVGIEVFHMADFMACREGFENWRGREPEQAALLLKLARITKDHVRFSVSTMVMLDDWNKVNKSSYALRENRCTPYALGGFFTMHKLMNWLRRRTTNPSVKFIFEDGDKDKGHFIWLVDCLWKLNKRQLAGVKPQFKDKTVAPLQTADFVMWEQLKLAKNRIENPESPAALRESFELLFSIKNHWGVMDEEMLLKFCSDFDVPKRGENRVWGGPFGAS
jgi:hypothetical protein